MAANEVVIVVRAEDKFSGVAKSAAGSFTDLGRTASFALAGGLIAAGAAGLKFVSAAREAREVSNQLDAVLKSTGGAAGVTRQAALDLAASLQKVTNFDDEAVLSGENMLLTFTKIGKGIFPEATEAALNMSQALGQDVTQSAVQLGKALNDPIAGATALRRVGVALTEQQQEQIKAFTESGDLLSAQKLILAELSTEFGGSARAAADPWKQFMNVIGDVEEIIGGALLPTVDRLSKSMKDFLTEHQADIERLSQLFANNLAAGIDKAADAAQNVIQFLAPIIAAIPPDDLMLIASIIGGALVTAVIAFGVASAIAFATNPITIWILAIAGVATALTLLVRHWDQIWAAMKAAPAAFLDWLKGGGWVDVLLGIFLGPLPLIIRHWKSIFGAMPEPVQNAMNAVAGIISKAINFIIDALNTLTDKINDIGNLGDKIGISIPDIPQIGHVGDFQLEGKQGTSDIVDGWMAMREGAKASADAALAAGGAFRGLGEDLGSGGGGLTGAAEAADTGLADLMMAFQRWNAVTGESLTAFVARLELQQQEVQLDREIADAQFRVAVEQEKTKDTAGGLRIALKELALEALKTGKTLSEVMRDAFGKMVDDIRSAFNGLFSRPTQEQAQLNLEIALKEEERARLRAAGASDEELDAIDAQIEALRNQASVYDAHADVLKAQIDAADQSLMTAAEQDFAAKLYIVAMNTLSGQYAQAADLAALESLARTHLIDAMNNAAQSYGASTSADDPFTAAEKHWINGVARGRGEPEPFPGFAQGLWRVPVPAMPVTVHQNEAILNAQDAEAWRQGRSGGGNTFVFIQNQNRYADPDVGVEALGLSYV